MTTLLATPAIAQDNAPPAGERATDVVAGASFQLARPSQVRRFNVSCRNATLLDVEVADQGRPGDHYEAKVKAWDKYPNTAVTTSPGRVGVYGTPATVYHYGGDRPGPLLAEVEVRYLHGVNSFPAGGILRLTPDRGDCVVRATAPADEIARSP